MTQSQIMGTIPDCQLKLARSQKKAINQQTNKRKVDKWKSQSPKNKQRHIFRESERQNGYLRVFAGVAVETPPIHMEAGFDYTEELRYRTPAATGFGWFTRNFLAKRYKRVLRVY